MDISPVLHTLHTALNSFGSLLRGGALPSLGTWNYLLLGLLSAIQGPVATLVGGTAASAGTVRLEWVFFTISASNLTLDLFWYAVGRAGKLEWLMGSNRFLKVQRSRVEKLKKVITDQSSQVVMLAKITTGFVLPTMIATGLARVPWKNWLPSLFLVEVGRTGILALLGYYSAKTLSQLLKGYSYLTIVGSVVMLLISGWVIIRILRLDEKMVQVVQK